MCGDEYFTVEVLAAVVEAVIPSVIRVISVDDEAVVSDEPDVSIAVIVVAKQETDVGETHFKRIGSKRLFPEQTII